MKKQQSSVSPAPRGGPPLGRAARTHLTDAAPDGVPPTSPIDTAAGPILDRLRRVEGQIRGVQRMIEERRSCEAILIQLLAARAALDRVAGQVVAAHLEECLAGRSPAAARASIERAVQLLARGG